MKLKLMAAALLASTFSGAAIAQEFNDQAEFQKQREQLSMTPQDPEGQPWAQHLGDAMVDAAIGGKNGVDIGAFKNMIGLVRQSEFLLYDYRLLQTLPEEEWINGWAEIIKHACIRDESMFALLEQHRLADFQNDRQLLHDLVQRNALLKAGIVQQDEQEQGDRKLLNFGHTLAHAIENVYQLPHGFAVSIGMVFAARLSEVQTGFKDTERILALLERYGLPVTLDFDKEQALRLMQADKKKANGLIHYILLETLGRAVIRPLPIEILQQQIAQ